MLGVIQAVTQTARNGTYLREKTLAHWVALNVITERRLQPSPPPIDETSDEVEFAGERWRWTLEVTQTEVDSLRRMDVSVGHAGQPDEAKLITVTGFYGTAVGAAGGGVLPWADAGSSGTDDDDDDDGGDTDGGDTNGGDDESGTQSSGRGSNSGVRSGTRYDRSDREED
jgi:general secretion pathway protein I